MLEEPPRLKIRQSYPRPTKAQIEAFQGVPTGFVCDAMEGRGALSSDIKPLGFGRDFDCHAAGPALVADNGPQEILATMGALHQMQAGDFIVAAVHGHTNCSAAGDQFCGMMKNKGAAGFVTDGAVRDYEGIVETGLPVWSAGLCPNSPFSNGPGVVGYGAVVGGVRIESGDMLVADRNGVVVVPFARLDEVIATIAHIKTLEETLEARVADGYCDMPAIDDMIKDGTAVVET
jgi:4-hydroxy-4-methyl-2-oxoglutarate aldolase